MQKFYFEENTNTYQQIFGHLLLATGCFLTLLINSAFIIVIFIGIKLLIKEGTAFEIKTNTYKLYKNILGIRLGYWKRLPKSNFITITTESEKENARSFSPSKYTNENYLYKINLYYSDTKTIKLYKTENIDDAYKTLYKLSKILNTKVYDTLQGGWL